MESLPDLDAMGSSDEANDEANEDENEEAVASTEGTSTQTFEEMSDETVLPMIRLMESREQRNLGSIHYFMALGMYAFTLHFSVFNKNKN